MVTERKQSKYEHPLAKKGVRNHVFHKEYLEPVFGHIASYDETEVIFHQIDEMQQIIGTPLASIERDLLNALRIPVIPGLPVGPETFDEYLVANTVFITNKPTDQTTISYSYPNAGRSVTRKEGWVSSDGQVFTDHNIKGVGKTKSVGRMLVQEEQRPGNVVGVTTTVVNDLIGTNTARSLGVVTPIHLPPIAYDEIIYKGNRIPAESYLEDETLLCIQRAWSSDIRVAALYRGIDESYLHREDLALMLKDSLLTRNVFKSRVNRFLRDARIVNEFNKENDTEYYIGCSKYLDGDYSYNKYAQAFREQMAINIAGMINGNYWHGNLSSQNTSIAGEIGDWDDISSVRSGELLDTNEDPSRFTLEAFRAKKSYGVLHRAYRIQALISAVLGNGDYITVDEWWKLVQEKLHTHNWGKNVAYPELRAMSVPPNPKSRDAQVVWEREFADFAKHFRPIAA